MRGCWRRFLNSFDFRAWVSHGVSRDDFSDQQVLIPLISGLGFHNYCQAAQSCLCVLIPLISGLGFHVYRYFEQTSEDGLNPFDFRAWVSQSSRTACLRGKVLIPLISGLGFHKKPVTERDLRMPS